MLVQCPTPPRCPSRCIACLSLHWHAGGADQVRLGWLASCGRQVLPVYRGRDWMYITEHLHDVLGKQLREAGDLVEASQHFMAQLPCAHNPENWQAYYLRQFLDTLQDATSAKVCPCKGCPGRRRPAVGVSSKQLHCGGSKSCAIISARKWAAHKWAAIL